jgi:hypothetical protein
MRMKRVVALVLLLAALTACVYQHIEYSIKDIQPVRGSVFASADLVVVPFEDARVLTGKADVRRESMGLEVPKQDGWFVNGEGFYPEGGVPHDLSVMLVRHIAASQLFKNVRFAERPESGVYLLRGRITEFRGYKEPSLKAAFLQYFALAGVLARLPLKSRYKGRTVLSDVQLIAPDGETVLWNGNVVGEVAGSDMAEPYGWSAYTEANKSLKTACEKLVEELAGVSPPIPKEAPKEPLSEGATQR